MKADTGKAYLPEPLQGKKMGFLFAGGFLVAFVLRIFEGKMDIVWKEGAAQLYRGSTNFFPMK